MKFCILSLLLIVCLSFDSAYGAWHLVWQDEFNGNHLNTSEWTYEIGDENGWGNAELEYYTEKNTRVEGGHLVIDVKVEDIHGKHFTSSRLNSKKSWTYGKFEARARMPSGLQLWPAIWLLPHGEEKYCCGPANGEIDIFEMRGEKPHDYEATIHYGGQEPNNLMSEGTVKSPVDLSADFHTYGVEWDHKEIRMYFDGHVFHTLNIDKMLWSGKGKNPYTKNGQPFDQPFYWLLNVAVGGNFFDQAPHVTVEQARQWHKHTMEVDYVRVYQWQ